MYWGTVDVDEIRTKIYDIYQNATLGVVTLKPVAEKPYPGWNWTPPTTFLGLPLSAETWADCVPAVKRLTGIESFDSPVSSFALTRKEILPESHSPTGIESLALPTTLEVAHTKAYSANLILAVLFVTIMGLWDACWRITRPWRRVKN